MRLTTAEAHSFAAENRRESNLLLCVNSALRAASLCFEGFPSAELFNSTVWDTKRQIIWLATALIFGTFVVYQHARDEAEGFDPAYFALLEIILLLVIGVMFYFYSKSSDK